ncbi:MAG: OmpA family protein [Myxococcales bacterium]|nr:OmpA family protein [Myxococcota bacterium]MDW8282909.1 OmpA family protein [Myxococcales bacterium]
MRLTPFAKVFITFIILAVVGYVAYSKLPPEMVGKLGGLVSRSSNRDDQPGRSPATRGTSGGAPIVIGVNDFGGAYALLLANDGATAGPASLFRKAGLDVEVRLIRGSKERLKAFDEGSVQVMLLTLDYLANLVPLYRDKGSNLKSFLLVDWSRGNVGIVARPEFTSIESLKRARIATTRNTPTHYFLLSLLDKSNLRPEEIDTIKQNLIFATKTPQAGEMFQRGEVDAVAIWEPHLSQAAAAGGGRVLVTTATATNLIADVLFAREAWIQKHEKDLPLLLSAYFDAVREMGRDPRRAIELAARAFEQKPEEIAATLKKIKPATFADNREFFGLEREDCAYDRLYLEASRFWQKEGLFQGPIPEPASTRWTKALEALAAQHKGERIVENFRFTAVPDKSAPSLLTKSVSIYFASGKSDLDPNARKVIDSFAETLSVFQNAYVRVEGNTDNVGSRAANIALSQRRADSVVNYLVERHRIARARLVAIGNGPDNPVADNRTPEGREMNRRTDFKIIKNPESDEATAPTAPTGAVQQVIERRQGEAAACYEKGLRRRGDLRGRVVLQLAIKDNGAVEGSTVEESTLGDLEVERCIAAVARRWRFPPGSGGVVRHTFNLQPN